ncbi:thymidine kinase, cytosolic-like [Actinia tenebrosa]|uniref:Thymidine kinase n=1 Tax=Actinia tenebrosa TaxID=6105 RepID=A0A6P8INS6_ACTTE|nr:thymidine kinase, cytosolic-like [Actinia tenebrosa]
MMMMMINHESLRVGRSALWVKMLRREIQVTFGALLSLQKIFSSKTPSFIPSKLTKMALVTIPELHNYQRHHSLSECPGQIQVIFGPMFSGKTTELLRRIKRYQIANHRCLVVKYEKDLRYNMNDVATHDKQTLAATACSVLYSIKKQALQATVIGIDEGQFFPDVVDFAEEMASEGKTVIVAALDGTFQRQAFGNVLNLVPLAESVVKLNAVCMNCFKDAAFTKRLGSDKKIEVIGGADKYMAVCRDCFKLAHIQDMLSNSMVAEH